MDSASHRPKKRQNLRPKRSRGLSCEYQRIGRPDKGENRLRSSPIENPTYCRYFAGGLGFLDVEKKSSQSGSRFKTSGDECENHARGRASLGGTLRLAI